MLQNGKSHPKNSSSRAGAKNVSNFFVKIPGFVVKLHRIPGGQVSTTAVLRNCILVPRRIHSMGGILFLDEPEAWGVNVTSPCDQRKFWKILKNSFKSDVALEHGSTKYLPAKIIGRRQKQRPARKSRQRTYKNSCSITNW